MTDTQGWRPIDTAPKDGTWVLVYLEDSSLGVHVYPASFGRIAMIGHSFAFDMPKPTHWMPLPQPPGGEQA